MNELFLDTTNNYLIFGLIANNKVLFNKQILLKQKFTEEAVDIIDKTLISMNYQWKDLDVIYLAIGPGSYTSVRVGITVIKIIATLNKKIKIYNLNSLLLQSGKQKIISIIEAQGNQYFLAAYDNGINIIEPQVIDKSIFNEMRKDLENFQVVKNYEDVDIFANFLQIKDLATICPNVNTLEPFYLKKLKYDKYNK